MSNGDPRKFVDDLEYALPEAKILRLGAFQSVEDLVADSEDENSAFVNGGSLMAFTANVTGQNRSDVLNSTLLAQLACDNLFNKEEQIVEWYRKYTEILSNIGWNLQEFNFSKYQGSQNVFSIDQALLEVLASALTGAGHVAILQKTIGAFKSLGDGDSRLTMFEKNSHSLTKGAFQIALATEENDSVAMAFGASHFESDANVKKILFAKFGKDSSKIYNSSVVGVLNPEVYGRVRGAVNNKLGKHTQDYVAQLPDLGF